MKNIVMKNTATWRILSWRLQWHEVYCHEE